MLPVIVAVRSSVGKKIIMAVTALSLVMFVIAHLLGNLQLFKSSPDAFNKYAHKLESLGGLLYIAELGLLSIFVIHIIIAFSVVIGKKRARPVGYYMKKGLGGPSKKSVGSSTMIYTGVIIIIFIIAHIIHFKFGPGIEQGYVKMVDDHVVRDLYRLVIEAFKNPVCAGLYTAVMVLLGFHLSHGFWSAFQSLGAWHKRYTPVLYGIGIFIAVTMGAGFLSIPLFIYFKG